jgi:hypothetical protein
VLLKKYHFIYIVDTKSATNDALLQCGASWDLDNVLKQVTEWFTQTLNDCNDGGVKVSKVCFIIIITL